MFKSVVRSSNEWDTVNKRKAVKAGGDIDFLWFLRVASANLQTLLVLLFLSAEAVAN